jgi:hypothetical protein
MVDAYLACRKIMPKWQGLDDMESIFWRFVYTVIAQIDSRPANERVREGEDENPTQNCKHVPLGQYRVTSGAYKGSVKSKQTRCKYCPQRKKKANQTGVSAAAFMTLPFVENTIVGNAIWQTSEEIWKKDYNFNLLCFYMPCITFFCTVRRI